jgi:hypothetical protein
MPAWWPGSLSSARRSALFKDISILSNTLVIVLNPMILVGLATVAANLFCHKTAGNFQSFGYGWWD